MVAAVGALMVVENKDQNAALGGLAGDSGESQTSNLHRSKAPGPQTD